MRHWWMIHKWKFLCCSWLEYTRSTRKQSQSEQNKSVITDHVNTENHIIDWEEATIIGRESDRTTWWIRQAVKIRQEAQDVMNRDKGFFFALPCLRHSNALLHYLLPEQRDNDIVSSLRNSQPFPSIRAPQISSINLFCPTIWKTSHNHCIFWVTSVLWFCIVCPCFTVLMF